MQKLRTALVAGVVVVGSLGAGGGFYLVQQTSPEAARSLLAVDAGMITALAVCVWVLLGPTMKRVSDVVEALRALARGEKHTRIDAADFAGLADVARAVNEVAAALCENDDPNLGPVQKKTRDHPTETHKVPKPARPHTQPAAAPGQQEASVHPAGTAEIHPAAGTAEIYSAAGTAKDSSHPEIGAVRVRKKPEPAPEPVVPVVAVVPVKVPSKPAQSTPEIATPGQRADDDTIIEQAAPEPRLPARAELQTLFGEFLKEKKAAQHPDVDDLEFEAFAETILAECERLVQEHNCRGVRFEVAIAEGEVSLRPRLLR